MSQEKHQYLDLLYFVRIAALLHDVGKISPKHFKDHSTRGANILRRLGLIPVVDPIAKGETMTLERVAEEHHDVKEKGFISVFRYADWASSRIDKMSKFITCSERKTIALSNPLTGNEERLSSKEIETYGESLENLPVLKDTAIRAHDQILDAALGLQRGDVARSPFQGLLDALRKVPSDTRYPMNDHSLWAHSKTCALFSEIFMYPYLSGASEYAFNTVTVKLNLTEYYTSTIRLPELREKTRRARKAIVEALQQVDTIEVKAAASRSTYRLSALVNVLHPDIVTLPSGAMPFIERIVVLTPAVVDPDELGERILREIFTVLEKPKFDFLDMVDAWATVNQSVVKGEPGTAWRACSDEFKARLKEAFDPRLGLRMKAVGFSANVIRVKPYEPTPGRPCGHCGIRPESIDVGPYVGPLCERCYGFIKPVLSIDRKLAGGAFVDDIADKRGNIAVIWAYSPHASDYLCDERPIFERYTMEWNACIPKPWSASRAMEILSTMHSAFLSASEQVEQEAKTMGPAYHICFGFSGDLEMPTLGHVSSGDKTYGAIASVTPPYIEVVGVSSMDLEAFEREFRIGSSFTFENKFAGVTTLRTTSPSERKVQERRALTLYSCYKGSCMLIPGALLPEATRIFTKVPSRLGISINDIIVEYRLRKSREPIQHSLRSAIKDVITG